MAYRFFFFAGGDYRSDSTNAFTGNFIRYLTEILGQRFSVIEGIYHPGPLMNVIWALNRAQEPERHPGKNRIIASSVNQILADPHTSSSQLTLVSSSYGSVVAAQAACHLAERHRREKHLNQSFNVALGASMVSKKSGLYRKLLEYQDQGIIGTIIFDELHDLNDNSNGIGGSSRFEAYSNALGICFPFMTRKFSGPSFLNTDPVTGHIHRVRAQSVQKAKDFLHTILIHYRLAGDEARAAAKSLLE
jgi:hypothetical protein